MNALNFVPVWTLILGAGIFFYVLLDGFDLGVGMLYNFMPDTRSRLEIETVYSQHNDLPSQRTPRRKHVVYSGQDDRFA
jgi:hypothetical protein